MCFRAKLPSFARVGVGRLIGYGSLPDLILRRQFPGRGFSERAFVDSCTLKFFSVLPSALDVDTGCRAHRENGQAESPGHPNFCRRRLNIELLHDDTSFIDELWADNSDGVGFPRIQATDLVEENLGTNPFRGIEFQQNPFKTGVRDGF